ncbi:hypothetical protein ACQKKX_02360 [Neorhizobium sp. NPDC001467]|uniref:hypothetical protein n=1 Tax=Neorhizobium sp. NPDC001467 TaxID=3390595 RepID=UPI003D05E8E3
MTVNESANLPDDGGSKTVEPLDIENSSALNFWEPEDDVPSDNRSAQRAETASGTGEAGDDPDQEPGGAATEDDDPENPDDPNPDDPDADKQPTDDAAIDETVVTLKGGEQVPVKELKLGYMRLSDYRTKTQEAANQRRSLEDMSNRVAGTAHAFANFLASQLPEEPSTQLAMTNPAAYTQQKVIYDSALQRINEIIAMGQQPQNVVKQLTDQQKLEKLHAEDEKLREHFPETATKEGREKFFEGAFTTGHEFGFSDEEMQGFDDHRYLRVIHYAQLGLAAEKAKAKAMQKMENAPPLVARGKPQQQNAGQVQKSKDAMARLTRTGSLKDAMNIDF